LICEDKERVMGLTPRDGKLNLNLFDTDKMPKKKKRSGKEIIEEMNKKREEREIKEKQESDKSLAFCCCCCSLLLLFIFILGGASFNYCLNVIVGKNIPFFVDCVGGVLTLESVILVAPFLWIAHWCGVGFPMVVL